MCRTHAAFSSKGADRVLESDVETLMHQDKRGYYYSSHRVGRTVTRRYLGNDPLWSSLMEYEACRRDELRHCRERNMATLSRLTASDNQAKIFHQLVSAVMQTHLEAAGFHQHARGQWRKQRKTKKEQENFMSKALCKTENQSQEVQKLSNEDTQLSATRESLVKLINQAADDPKQSRELLSMVKGTALEPMILRIHADIGSFSREKIIESLGKQPLFQQSCARKIELMREDLSGTNPSPLETLLIERILNNWLQVNQLEQLVSVQEAIQWMKIYEERLDKAHKRYLASIKALAQVRKLQLPDVQVNIAEKQVNVAQMNVSNGSTQPSCNA